MMKAVSKSFQGFFWHIHHDRLVEWSSDIRERIGYIKKNKPKSEVETRLRLMKKIKGKIPVKLQEADAKRKEADAKLKEADAKLKEADAKWNEACAKWNEADAKRKEADAKWEEANAKFLPQLEKLHAKECNCKEWNGKRLVFEKADEGN